MRIFIVFLAISLGAVGCASTGGEIGGLLPAPKITKGTLKEGLYTAKDGSFSVMSPFPFGSYEYLYMKVEEHYTKGQTQIIFSSSPAPAEVYRIHTLSRVAADGFAPSPEFASQELLNAAISMFEEGYGTALNRDGQGFRAGGNLEFAWQSFIQEVPERRGGFRDRYMAAQAMTVQHRAYQGSRGDELVFVWINRPVEGKLSGATPAGKAAAEERELQFIESFRLLSLEH